MMSFHGHRTSTILTLTLQQATVQIQPTKVILTGSGQIEQPATPKNGLILLLQQTFVHDWSWELMIVGNIHDLIDDIQASNGFSISNVLFQEGRGAAA